MCQYVWPPLPTISNLLDWQLSKMRCTLLLRTCNSAVGGPQSSGGVEGGYLQQRRAPWISAARDARRPRRPVRPPLGNCCSASPTCGGSAWRPHARPPGPGPAVPGEPSAAGFRTGGTEGTD